MGLNSFDNLRKGIIRDYNLLIKKENKTQSEVKFINDIEKILSDEKTQKEYKEKYKHLDILKYDSETFMPIYKGVSKWKSENKTTEEDFGPFNSGDEYNLKY